MVLSTYAACWTAVTTQCASAYTPTYGLVVSLQGCNEADGWGTCIQARFIGIATATAPGTGLDGKEPREECRFVCETWCWDTMQAVSAICCTSTGSGCLMYEQPYGSDCPT